jgi:hypothetical protein
LRVFSAVAAAAGLLLAAAPAQAATCAVSSPLDSGPNTLRACVTGAATGDTVTIPAAMHITVASPVTITHAITISGGGATSVIDGAGVTGVFIDTSTDPAATTFQNLEITGGKLTVTVAHGGGGAAIDDSGGKGLVLSSATIAGNVVNVTAASSGNAGGAIYEGTSGVAATGLVTVSSSTFTNNAMTFAGTSSGNDGGGAIYSTSSGLITLTNDTFAANTVTGTTGTSAGNDGGGAIYDDGGNITVSGGSYAQNAVAITGSEGNAGGGAIYNNGGTFTITGATFAQNSVSIAGGTNSNSGGGAIYNDGVQLAISGSELDGNTFRAPVSDSSGGGAIYNDGTTASITGSTLAQNGVTLTGTTTYSGGGGLYNDGTTLTAVNATISDNTLTSPAGTAVGGAGIYNNGTTAAATNVTLAANASSQGAGAFFNDGAAATFKSSLLAGNGATQCASAAASSAFATAGNSIESTSPSQCGLAAASGDLVGVDPTLAPLGDYGGNHLPVHALYVGSPALDHVPAAKCTDQSTPTPQAVSTDEIGTARNSDANGCDVGAFEGSVPAPTPTPTTTTPTPVPAPPPVNTVPPVIKGTPLPPNTLTCLPGTWTIAVVPYEIAPPPLTYTFQWYRNGVPIPGATSARYTVQISDEGASLTCQVTAGDTSGHSTAQSGAAVVAMPGTTNCDKPSGKLTTSKVGPLALGETRAAARKALKHFRAQSPSIDDFCLFGGWGIRAGYPSAKLLAQFRQSKKLARRIVLALTANIHYSVNGVTQGSTIKQASKKLKLGKVHHIGKNDWYVTTSGRYVLKARKGVIQEIGPANAAFTHGYKAQTAFLSSFSSV